MSPPQSEHIKIDTRAPVVDQGPSGTFTRVDAVAPSFSATDPTPGSGIDVVTATYDGSPVSPGVTIDVFWTDLGQHNVSVSATDVAGLKTDGQQQFEIIATFDSLEATIRELRARGEITRGFVEWSFLHSVKAAARENHRAQHGGWFAHFHSHMAKAWLHALLHKIEVQRGHHLSNRAADLLAGDVNYVSNSF